MSDHSHRGASRGPLVHGGDRRILELDEALRGVEAVANVLPGLGLFRDATRAAASKLHLPGGPVSFSRGTVVHAIPGVNWYKVQMGDGAGFVAACLLSHGTFMPLGPRDLSMVGPNDDVLVMKPRGLNHGFIVGVIPPYASDGSVLCPDWVVQGGGSGLRRERGHGYPIKSLYKSGGVVDWSTQRPQDQTPLDRGWVSPFGPVVMMDDFMVQARVTEMAGLWVTLVDEWVRLAGRDLLIESAVHEENGADDEGESRYFKGIATYPHEALGQYKDGQAFTEEVGDKEVQYTEHRGKVDLKKGEEDLQPIYRYQEYGGYLGQGHLRLVARPGKESGSRKFSDANQDDGLFMEAVGLDGSYSLVSAKSLHLGKRCRIVVPKQREVPQAKAGDDAAEGNYKFSSLHGGGKEHKVGDVRVTGEAKSALRAAAVMDLISYDLNWKALHPFHYHEADYDLPQSGDGTLKVQESVDYGSAAGGFFVADPTPKTLKIDHRYGNVEYFERESFVRMGDDGNVHIAAGAGEEIILGGGRIRMNAPAGLDLCPGTDFVVLADQIVMRAKGSIDLSSSEKDVRLKAEKNMQLLAGNGGRGGILIESKGTGTTQQYKNKYGEDVRASGVVLKAAKGQVAVLGSDIYLRTGGTELGEGDILLDASMGKRRVQVYGKEFHTYTTKAVTFNYGPIEKSSSVNRVYYFGDKSMIADVRMLLGGKLIGYEGGGGKPGVVVDGGISAVKSIACGGVMSDKKGMFLGKVPPGFIGKVQAATFTAAEAAAALQLPSMKRHETTVVKKFYEADRIGDEDTVKNLKFSFRDPAGSPKQYKTEEFKWPEARWQQFVRFGLGSGGVGWTEKPVIYQGRPTYPWPGKQKWVDEPAGLQLSELTMFDAGAGTDKARPGPYEQPEVGEMTPSPLDGQYKLLR